MNHTIHTRLFLIGILLSSLVAFPFILDPTLSPRFIALAICLTAIACLFYKSDLSWHLKADLTLLAYCSYTLFCVVSIFWSTTKSEAIFESFKQVLNLFIFSIAYVFFKKDHLFFKALLKASILLFVLIFAFSLFQIFELENFDKESIYAVKGFQGHKNLLSSFLFLNLFFLIIGTYKLEKIWKVTAAICIVASFGLLLFLRTKAVWVGLGISLALFFCFYALSSKTQNSKIKIKPTILLIFGLIFLNIFFLFFLQPIIQKSSEYTSQADTSGKFLPSMKLEQERLVLWDKTYHLIKQKPILGVGLGNWQIHLPDASLTGLWRGEDLNYTFQRPHNDFLWLLSELGLVGFNLFLLFLLSVLFLLIRVLWLNIPHLPNALDILLCFAFIAGYYVISFFDFPRERIEHGIWINLILAFAYSMIKKDSKPKEYFSLKIGRIQFGLLAALFIFISVVGILRFKGEFFMRRMLIYKSNNQLADVIRSGDSGKSFAYSIDATSVPISWYTGNAKAALGRFEEAQKDFISAFRLTPFNKNVLNDLGSSYVYTNDVVKAKFYYEEAARISPRYDEPKLNLASIYINAKDYKTASMWLRSLLHDSERRKKYEQTIEFIQGP